MKSPNVLFFVLLATVFLTACHSKAKKAKVYHDNILQAVQVVIDSSLDYGDATQSGNRDRALRGYERYAGLVDNTIAKVKEAGNFDGDTVLEAYSLELLGFYKHSLQQDFKPFLNSIQSDSLNADESRIADSLYSKMAMTENQYWSRFNWAEKKFYKEHDLASVE